MPIHRFRDLLLYRTTLQKNIDLAMGGKEKAITTEIQRYSFGAKVD